MRVHWLLVLAAGLVVGAISGFLLTSPQLGAGRHQVPIWLEVVQRICTSVGGLGTFAALLYVMRQFNLLKAQSDLVQKNVMASLDGQVYSRLDSFNKFVVEHDAEYELLDKPYGGDVPGHRAKLHHLCDLGFTFYEQIYKHHVRYDLLDTEDWEKWQQHMVHFFSKPYVRGYWHETRIRYAKSFREYVDSLLATTGQAGQPA